ncbi:MAG: GNAT family protein [Patescibacteria group bacterium]|nr:GNAT family protein [Patescibacteria group bacterium]
MKQPILKAGKIVLRRPKKTDAEDRYKCGHCDEITLMYGGEKKDSKYTKADAERWYRKQLERKPGWVIEYGGECVGEVFLHHIDETDKRARIALGFFNQNFLGKGVGPQVIDLILEYSFNDLGLHRVDLRVLDYNKRAIRAYEKSGFTIEGIERESAFIRGKWHNDIIMSILEHEYKKAL